MLDFFVSDIKLQAIYKVIPTSNLSTDGVVFSCQQIEVNTFYKCIEFQVNSFDSYWEILINTKQISQISMYYVETRADNSGYTNHRVICLVVIGSSFDSEQVFQVSNGYLW